VCWPKVVKLIYICTSWQGCYRIFCRSVKWCIGVLNLFENQSMKKFHIHLPSFFHVACRACSPWYWYRILSVCLLIISLRGGEAIEIRCCQGTLPDYVLNDYKWKYRSSHVAIQIWHIYVVIRTNMSRYNFCIVGTFLVLHRSLMSSLFDVVSDDFGAILCQKNNEFNKNGCLFIQYLFWLRLYFVMLYIRLSSTASVRQMIGLWLQSQLGNLRRINYYVSY